MKRNYLFIFVVTIFLIGCANQSGLSSTVRAPVVDGVAAQSSNSALRDYRVRAGDTLYSIAWRFSLDYNDLATLNQLTEPYTLRVGQQLRLKAGGDADKPIVNRVNAASPARSTTRQSVPTSKTVTKPIAKSHPKPTSTRYVAAVRWQWPAHGKVIKTYSNKGNASNKGIDIAGKRGQSVNAAAAGKVVYCGNGLRGYGRLVIIKHNTAYLSAYAHNDKLLVKEGQMVKAGQKIAQMGSSDARRVQLHFEIRKQGKPVDPLRYLPKA